MLFLGIDVGTDSVRLCAVPGDSANPNFYERPLLRSSSGSSHTMSGRGLWDQITHMLKEADDGVTHEFLQPNPLDHSIKDVSSQDAFAMARAAVCVAATCSTVVVERVRQDNGFVFRPLDPNADVIVWMDTRAAEEAQELSRSLPAAVLAQIGGSVTPEMGVAKLAWIARQFGNLDVYAFELYDWVTYLFMVGGYTLSGTVPFIECGTSFPLGSTAMDGSVKGWDDAILAVVGPVRVGCAPNFFQSGSFVPVGSPLALTSQNLLLGHGCIDSYAAWAGLFSMGDLPSAVDLLQCTLTMVAGTSTCFVASVDNAEAVPVEGLWGPFPQLAATQVFSFGQPATGQLFSELFQDFSAVIGNQDPFVFVEGHAAEIERSRGHPLAVLCRHYFYYGDKHGNRSPLGDFRMDEVFVNGANAVSDDTLVCRVADLSPVLLVVRYYLTLEFLALQTRQLCDTLAAGGAEPTEVYLIGSQARNQRFLDMLALFTFAGAHVLAMAGERSKYAGCEGIALCAAKNFPDLKLGENLVGFRWRHVNCERLHPRISRILQAKYRAFTSLATWQHEFHQAVDS